MHTLIIASLEEVFSRSKVMLPEFVYQYGPMSRNMWAQYRGRATSLFVFGKKFTPPLQRSNKRNDCDSLTGPRLGNKAGSKIRAGNIKTSSLAARFWLEPAKWLPPFTVPHPERFREAEVANKRAELTGSAQLPQWQDLRSPESPELKDVNEERLNSKGTSWQLHPRIYLIINYHIDALIGNQW